MDIRIIPHPVKAFWLGLFPPVEQIARCMSRARYDLEDRLIRFGAGVCRLTERLPTTAVGKHVVVQLIRSGTSPLANYGEVQGAESRRDFIHKLPVASMNDAMDDGFLRLVDFEVADVGETLSESRAFMTRAAAGTAFRGSAVGPTAADPRSVQRRAWTWTPRAIATDAP